LTLTGLTGGSDGRIIVLINRNTGAGASLTITNQDAGSSGANRFFCPRGVSYVLGPSEAVVLKYSAGLAAWVVLAKSATEGWNEITASTDLSVIDNITLQDDTVLQFEGEATVTYEIELRALFTRTAAAATGARSALAFPALTNNYDAHYALRSVNVSAAIANIVAIATSTTQLYSFDTVDRGTNIVEAVVVNALIRTNGAGTIKHQFCTTTTVGVPEIVRKAGSRLRYRKLL
jgi:hypothetical protein